jgi:hypothetical protein
MLLLWVLGVWNGPRDYANPDLIWIITVLKLQTFESWLELAANITFLRKKRKKKKKKKKKKGSKWWDPGPGFLQVCRPTTSLLDFHFLC